MVMVASLDVNGQILTVTNPMPVGSDKTRKEGREKRNRGKCHFL